MCQKSASELQADDPSRQSFVVPIDDDALIENLSMKACYNTVDSHTKEGFGTHPTPDKTGRGGGQGLKEVLLGKVPKNVYGSSEFIVKVQVPYGRGPNTRCLCYDARRTLGNLYFECDQYGAAGLRCVELVHSSAEEHKGHFQARREGANLRIFVDRILEPQPW